MVIEIEIDTLTEGRIDRLSMPPQEHQTMQKVATIVATKVENSLHLRLNR